MSALVPAVLVALAVIGAGLAVAAFVGVRREPDDACVPGGWSAGEDLTNGGAGDAAPATATDRLKRSRP